MPSQTASPTATSLADLCQHIIDTHHVYLRNELPFLEERIAKMCANHGQDRPNCSQSNRFFRTSAMT